MKNLEKTKRLLDKSWKDKRRKDLFSIHLCSVETWRAAPLQPISDFFFRGAKVRKNMEIC